MRLAFLASHNGSAARAIASTCRDGALGGDPVLLISNNDDAGALAWAAEMGLAAEVVNAANSYDPDNAIAALLKKHEIDLVVCSGYMKLIGPFTIGAMHGAVLNIHPALLPRHGGQGMYGRRVHQAVRDSGEAETGITIHLVDGEYDHGRIVAQKQIPVLPGDSVEDIEEKVKSAEPDFYIETLRRILSGEISLR